MPFYEKGDVRIHYEEAGSGFPLLLIPGGGLNSTISFFTGNAPFNAIEELQDQYRCITMDLRNALPGRCPSTPPCQVLHARGSQCLEKLRSSKPPQGLRPLHGPQACESEGRAGCRIGRGRCGGNGVPSTH